jgi:hypothetical protein
MTVVSIRIQDAEDKDKPLIPEFQDAKKYIHGDLQVFGILEKGMQGGATSVSFCAKAENGTVVILETSAKNFMMMAATLQGAEQRFANKKTSNN